MNEHGNIIIYKDKNGNDNIEVKLQDNTVWLNQEQLVKLYNSSKSNISEHIKHIFEVQKSLPTIRLSAPYPSLRSCKPSRRG